jgi:hypothetical protein
VCVCVCAHAEGGGGRGGERERDPQMLVVCTIVGRMLESCVQRIIYESRYCFILDALTRGEVARTENRVNFTAMLKGRRVGRR